LIFKTKKILTLKRIVYINPSVLLITIFLILRPSANWRKYGILCSTVHH